VLCESILCCSYFSSCIALNQLFQKVKPLKYLHEIFVNVNEN